MKQSATKIEQYTERLFERVKLEKTKDSLSIFEEEYLIARNNIFAKKGGVAY